MADLEGRIAALLGKPAAVFLPSGTMAQQAVLRVHADQRQRRTVLFHPCCHIDVHEGRGYQRLHQLTGRPVGDPHRLLSVADLAAVAEPPAALVLELPQRDLGGQQPPWDELAAQLGWARQQGAAVHLDGARLWESAAGYGRPPADIAGLFDTVYVSFYKGLGALPGCCVACPDGRHRPGPRVAAPDGRHAVRAVAQRRLGADLPGPAAAADAAVPGARPGHRGRAVRRARASRWSRTRRRPR